MRTSWLSGDQHGHMTPTLLEHLDHLVVGEATGGRRPDTKDVVTCSQTSVLIGGHKSQSKALIQTLQSAFGL